MILSTIFSGLPSASARARWMSFSFSSAAAVTSSFRMNCGSAAATCMAMSCTSSWKSSVRATKSDSQFTSTSTPNWPPWWMYVPINPCLVVRDAFLLAEVIPFLRNTTSAAGKSPLASVSALLHSIIPAPVRSRNCLTSCAVISAIFPQNLGVRSQDSGEEWPRADARSESILTPDFCLLDSLLMPAFGDCRFGNRWRRLGGWPLALRCRRLFFHEGFRHDLFGVFGIYVLRILDRLIRRRLVRD